MRAPSANGPPAVALTALMESESPVPSLHLSMPPQQQQQQQQREPKHTSRNGRDRRRSSEDSTEVDVLLIGMGRGGRHKSKGHHQHKHQQQHPQRYGSDGTSVVAAGSALAKSDGVINGKSDLTSNSSSSGRDADEDAMLYLLEEQEQYAVKRKFHVSDKIWVSAIANLSTAYNLAVINYALMMIRQTYPASSPQLTSMVASCSLVGAIMGQLTFGYIGDAIGRKRGMIFTLLLSIGGALASAILPWGVDSIYYTLAVCRFVLGLGVGGVYPLSATTASEATKDPLFNSKIVAAVFSFQGIGQLLAPLVTYLLLESRIAHTLGWRLLLAIGALPGIFVLQRAFNAKESTQQKVNEICGPGLWNALKEDKSLCHKLIGAAVGWFLFDITFYGNVIFTPIILEDAFGYSQKHLVDVARCSVLVALIALPGYFVTVLAVGRLNFKTIQVMGFVMMALIFFVIGVYYEVLLNAKAVLLGLYALTFFFSNFGPNVSTFCLPAEIFPADVRVKLNGVAAASGKIGATVGAAVFGMIEKEWGVAYVLVLSAMVSLVGAVITLKFIPGKKYQS